MQADTDYKSFTRTQTGVNSRYQELDALRGVAALMVVLFHLSMDRPEAQLGFKLGTTGVELFFIISGFVISLSVSRIRSTYEFIINRISRLYPTYWASVTFTFLLITLYGLYKNEPLRLIDYLANMTMFQYYIGVENLDPPYWTMIVEMVFYIFVAFLFWVKLWRYIIPIGACLLVMVVTIRGVGDKEVIIAIFNAVPLLEFFPLFFAGVLFYRIMHNQGTVPVMYGLVIATFGAQLMLFDFAGRSRVFISFSEYSVMVGLFYILFICFINRKLAVIAWRPLVFLGKISFALYLTHQYLLLGHVFPLLSNRLALNFWLSAFGVCVPLAIAVAYAITFFVEIPGNRKMKSFLYRVIARTKSAQPLSS